MTTPTTNEGHALVIHDPAAKGEMPLVVAARLGNVIRHTRLAANCTDLEAARREAQALYPDRLIVVPRLGEAIPSVPAP